MDSTWFHLNSDKFCIQGRQDRTTVANGCTTITLKKAFKNTNYSILITDYATATDALEFGWYNKTKTTFDVVCSSTSRAFSYTCFGYIS